MKRHSVLQNMVWANTVVYKSAPIAYSIRMLLILPQAAGIVVGLLTTRTITNLIVNTMVHGRVEFQPVLVLLAANLIVYILGIVQECIDSAIKLRTQLFFERQMCEKLSRIQWEYYESFSTEQKIENVSTKAEDAVIKSFKHLCAYIFGFLQLIIFVYFMAAFHWSVIIIYFIVLFISMQLSNRVFKSNYTIWERIVPLQKRERYEKETLSNVTMHQESQHNRMLPWTIQRWKRLFEEEHVLRIKIFKRYEVVMQLSRLIMNLPYFLMILYSAILVMRGQQDMGMLVMYLNMFNQVVNLFGMIEGNIFSNQANSPFIQDCMDVMHWTDQRQRKNIIISNLLEFSHVYYRYPQSETDVMTDFSFQAHIGERIAIVGANGSGKTTFALLLSGLIENIERGQIRIDGQENVVLDRKCVQYVFQDFVQYQMTLRENIAIGSPDRCVEDTEIETILKKVGLYDFVAALPLGIQTPLGQLDAGGIELSKGQWQRLVIARLLVNPEAKIWVLDEPTAYLDPLSEIAIYDLVNSLAANKMVLFISHRLGFARQADRILVFEKGRIVGDGVHEDLLDSNPLYKRMYQIQRKWYSCT